MNMSQGGQTIMDRVNSARFGLAGHMLAKAVCKATTEEQIGPKKKHLDCKGRKLQYFSAFFSRAFSRWFVNVPRSHVTSLIIGYRDSHVAVCVYMERANGSAEKKNFPFLPVIRIDFVEKSSPLRAIVICLNVLFFTPFSPRFAALHGGAQRFHPAAGQSAAGSFAAQ